MIIVAIDDNKIYAYHDGNMCVFNKKDVGDTSAVSKQIGAIWKASSRLDSESAPVDVIESSSRYADLLMEALINLSKVAIDFTQKLS